MCIINTSGKLTGVNPAFEKVLGYKDHEAMGKSLSFFLHENETHQNVLEEMNTQDEVITCIFMTKEKKQVWISWQFFEEEDAVLGIGQDVTEEIESNAILTEIAETHKQMSILLQEQNIELENNERNLLTLIQQLDEAKQALKESLRETLSKHIELSVVFDAVLDCILSISPDKTILSANSAVFHIFGYTPEEIIGKKLNCIVLDDVMEGYYETRGIRKNGIHFPIGASYNVAHLYENQIIVGVLRDLSEIRKNQIALQNAQKQAEEVFESLNAFYWMLDVDNNSLLTHSSTMENIVGYNKECIEKNNIGFEIIAHQDRDFFMQKLRQIIEAEEETKSVLEYRIINPNGKIKWLRTHMKSKKDALSNQKRIDGISIDITHLMETEAELHQTKIYLQNILQAIPDAIFFVDTQNQILWINEAAQKISLHEAPEILGKNIYKLLDMPDLASLTYHKKNINYSSVYQAALRKKGGSTFYAEIISVDVQDINKNKVGILKIIRDISEIKKQELEKFKITKSLAEFKYTLDVMRDGVFMFEAETLHFFYANKGACVQVGYDEKEIMTKTPLDIWKNFSLLPFRKMLNQLRQLEHHEISFETIQTHQNGTTTPIEVMLQFVEIGSKGRRYVAIVRDISERKSAEKKLKKNELQFRTIFEQAVVGICYTSLDLKETFLNERFYEILGYSKGEIYFQTLIEIAHPSEKELLQAHIIAVFEEQKTHFSMEKRFVHKSGKLVWVEFSMYLVRDESNQPAFYVVIIQDISAKKESEIKLKKTLAELRDRNYELDQFVYKTSHDLRSPLTSIMGIVQLIKLEQNNPQKITEYLNMIDSSINKLDTYIQSILYYSKSNNYTIKYTKIDFDAMIRELLLELQFMKNTHLLRLIPMIKQDVPFINDALRIRIIFKNILSNAIKYMNLNRENNYLKIKIETTPQKASILFEDNGIGIHYDLLPQIFTMFFRASENSEGSGLGLYIVKQTLEKLEGTVEVKSNLGQGTVFSIEIPNVFPTSQSLEK